MNALIRWTFPLIAYLCVGTVITASLGYGYLRHSGKLDDEKLFRITALVHGVDLDALAEEGHAEVEDAPPEEPSFADQLSALHTATLRFDAKQKQLEDSLNNFDYQRKQVTEKWDSYVQLQTQVENYFESQRKKLAESDLANVRAQLEALIPKKQAKPLLIKYIAAGEIDKVIQLLETMKPRSRENILKTFDAPEDIEMLFQLQRHMLNDNPAIAVINEQLKTLNQLRAQNK